jgi:predicted transposase YbfD/YdcC
MVSKLKESNMSQQPNTSIDTHFGQLTDPRTGKNIQHPLINIITLAICGVISGADNWVDVESYGNSKNDFFDTFLNLEKGIPSHDTFGRVFRWIDPEEFGACFMAWTQRISALTNGEIVAIDGKCLRGSKDSTHERDGMYLVNAWASNNRLVLGQEKVSDKSNEITAIPVLLKLLDLEGCVVTMDAMGCQTDVAEMIIDQQADYVLAVKGNQATLQADITTTFEVPTLHTTADYYRHYDHSHGRDLVRECWVVTDPAILEYINGYKVWKGAQSVVKVLTRRGHGDQLTVDTRYFISSLKCDARTMLDTIRTHWQIENGLHWVLDIAFREDDSRVRRDHAPHNMALLRQIALNLLKQETSLKIGVKARRKRAGWDNAYLLKVLRTGF